MKITCLIVDDEPLAVQLLKRHVAEIDHLELIGTCGNAIEASSFLLQQEVDLIFLDIQMPRLTGIEFLKAMKRKPAVIITTAHREYALDGYELDIVDYLLKPITFERFLSAIERFGRTIKKQNESFLAAKADNNDIFLSLKAGTKIYQFKEASILYIESMRDFIKIHLVNGKKPLLKYQISQVEAELSTNFIRVHKSFIVNKNHVTAISNTAVEIEQLSIPIGDRYKQEVELRFKKTEF